jgi:hypothetical protein
VGRITARVTVTNLGQLDRQISFAALVDTGSYCPTLPAAWKADLGVLASSKPVEAETADQRVVNGSASTASTPSPARRCSST